MIINNHSGSESITGDKTYKTKTKLLNYNFLILSDWTILVEPRNLIQSESVIHDFRFIQYHLDFQINQHIIYKENILLVNKYFVYVPRIPLLTLLQLNLSCPQQWKGKMKLKEEFWVTLKKYKKEVDDKKVVRAGECSMYIYGWWACKNRIEDVSAGKMT